MCYRVHIAMSLIYLLTWVYLGDESESLHCGHSHRSSSLLCSSQLNVLGEIVPVRSWLEMRRACPRRLHFLPAPLGTPLSLRQWVVKSVSTRVRLICSLTRAKTVGGSRVRVDSFVASPASASARSLPRTPACPGQKIHRTHWRLLCLMEVNQSA